MSKIQATFERLQAQGRKALIPFITAGDPDPALTVPLMHTLVEAGADIIELGVPFSDPMADGPTIQRASERALLKGVSLRKVLGMVANFRADNNETPVVLMGYANPIEAMGVEAFAAAAFDAGVDGVLVVDYPPEESDRVCAGPARQCARSDLPAGADLQRRAHCAGRRAGQWLHLLRFAEGRHRFGGARRRRGGRTHPGNPGPHRRSGRRRFRYPRCGDRRRGGEIADAVVVGSRIIEEIEQSVPAQACANVLALVAEIRRGMDAATSTSGGTTWAG